MLWVHKAEGIFEMTTSITKPMTEPQFSYLIKLVGQAYADNAALRSAKLVEAAGYDFGAASAAIDALKAKLSGTPAAKPVKQMPAYVPPFGHYVIDGDTVQIKQPKHAGGPIYVFKNDCYVGAVGFKGNAVIASLDTPEKAHAAVVAYAQITGKCGVCNTKLTNPKSIAAGIGPICAKNYGM
jgi:hypothetical protein